MTDGLREKAEEPEERDPCTTKMSYRSESQARAAAMLSGLGLGLKPYECDRCGAWHLTSTN